jgi:hypothetical protein
MENKKFKSIPRRKRDEKAIDSFVSGADVKANSDSSRREAAPKKKSGKKEGFYTTLQSEHKERIQALAYYLRISQREVIERALKESFPEKSDTVQKALEEYRAQD